MSPFAGRHNRAEAFEAGENSTVEPTRRAIKWRRSVRFLGDASRLVLDKPTYFVVNLKRAG